MTIDTSYFSLYQNPRNSYYYIDGQEEAEYNTYVGFKDQNDLTNPIIACDKAVSTCTEDIKNTEFVLQGVYQAPGLGRFRLFVPPGTTYFSLMSHVMQGTNYVCVARLGSPPNNPDSSTSTANTDGFTLEQLRAGDCVNCNSSGYLKIASDYAPDIKLVEEGGWLYFVIRAISGGNDNDIVSSHHVYVGDENTPGTYLYWYLKQAVFGEDGDPGVAAILPTCSPTGLDFGYINV